MDFTATAALIQLTPLVPVLTAIMAVVVGIMLFKNGKSLTKGA